MVLKSKDFRLVLLASALIATTALIISGPTVLAQEAETACRGIVAAGGDCGGGEDQLNNVIRNIINILLYIVGIASVIALVVGGIRYAVSGGDQQAVATAKNTVIYSIVGLIVAFLAYAIVNYVFGEL